jgi:hypothetical protein
MLRVVSLTITGFMLITGSPETGRSQYYRDGQVAADSGVNHEIQLPRFTDDPSYRNLLREGLSIQQLIDTLSDLSIYYRTEAVRMDQASGKYRIQQKVVVLEDSIRQLDMRADRIFSLISAMEKDTVSRDRPFLELYAVTGGIRVYCYKIEQMHGRTMADKPVTSTAREDSPDSSLAVSLQFRIFPVSPYSDEQPIDTLFEIPGGVFYWIQLGAFSGPVKNDYFGGLCPLTMIRMPGQELVKYYAGRFTRIEDARLALGQIREYGLSDAFIVGYFERQNMPVTRVEQYEKKYDNSK